MKYYLSTSDVAKILGVSEKWVYSHARLLNPARAMLNGKPVRPARFHPVRLEAILSGSLKSDETSGLRRKVGRL